MSNASSIGTGISFGAPTRYFEHQKKWGCSAFLDTVVENPLFKMKAEGPVGGKVQLTIQMSSIVSRVRLMNDLYMEYWAASPPTYLQNFSGSGLPYPTKEIAFENSPNRGRIPIRDSEVQVTIDYPNSYYDEGGSIYVPPTFSFIIRDKNGKDVTAINEMRLGEGIPYRTLQWPRQRHWLASAKPFGGSMFYTNLEMPKVRSQEQILRESAYPLTNMEAKNFWGLKPPM